MVPAYALTIHKTQALSIKHIVLGSLEGVFALGQVYVLISRVTDPRNFYLLGMPPKDLLEDLASELIARGISVDEFFETACRGALFSREREMFLVSIQSHSSRRPSVKISVALGTRPPFVIQKHYAGGNISSDWRVEVRPIEVEVEGQN